MSGEGCKKSAKPILHPKYRAENNAVLVSNGYGIGHLPSVAAVTGVCLFVCFFHDQSGSNLSTSLMFFKNQLWVSSIFFC